MAMKHTIQRLCLGLILGLASLGAQAAVANLVTVNFTYTGSALYDMTGSFVYDYDASYGGVMNELEVGGLNYTVYTKPNTSSPSALVLHVDWTADKSGLRFSYDTVNNQFSASGNNWQLNGFGFQISSLRGADRGKGVITTASGVDKVDAVNVAAAFKITPVTTPVPEPETYGLMLLGLGVVGAVVRRRQQA